MYLAQERSGFPTHPLADMFFCTEDKKLVLVDITGGQGQQAKKKDGLYDWITQEQDKDTDFELHAVVLAPLTTGLALESS